MSLQKILKGVSRSFYLSLIFLPRRVRRPISLAFLACKAADTIADTCLIPKLERLKLLDAYREMFSTQANGFAENIAKAIAKPAGGSEAENTLIKNLPALMEALALLPPKDWVLTQELVLELTQGMQMDLKYFPGETEKELRAFQTTDELEQYIYYVAGCVGKFWTKMMKAHFEFAKDFDASVEACGERLGKGLQLVNVLRDLPRDLRQGRCYIPLDLLAAHNLTPHDLVEPGSSAPGTHPEVPGSSELVEQAKNYLGEYKRYCSFFPKGAICLKAVVRLPARLGFKTLELLEKSNDWLNPSVLHKVSRGQVYQTLLRSFLS